MDKPLAICITRSLFIVTLTAKETTIASGNGPMVKQQQQYQLQSPTAITNDNDQQPTAANSQQPTAASNT